MQHSYKIDNDKVEVTLPDSTLTPLSICWYAEPLWISWIQIDLHEIANGIFSVVNYVCIGRPNNDLY